MFPRSLKLQDFKYSHFLLGPRQTGKTSLIKSSFSSDLFINLLKHQEFLRYSRNPELLSQEISNLSLQKPSLIVIDEIQRVPSLLNEIQILMDEQPHLKFILTGSSARKLRKTGTNLLGGRAQTLHLHPLTHEELGTAFSLEEVLQYGSLPRIASEENVTEKTRFLKSYAEIYLKEEIQQEALTRNIPAFAHFLELAAFENGNILNYTDLSKTVGVDPKTIKDYFQILVDTLIGFFLFPYKKSHRTRIVSHPRFYFFDLGVVSALQKRISVPLISGTPPFGNAFERWILLELQRILDYRQREANLFFFRTNDGAEVDVVLEIHGEIWAIEIKASSHPTSASLSGLKSFIEDHRFDRALCLCQTPRAYRDGAIEIIPWQQIFNQI